MNRTALFLGAAALLTLSALVASSTRLLPATPTSAVAIADGDVRVEVRPSHKLALDTGAEQFVEVTVSGSPAHVPPPQRVSMAIVLDHSGSMQGYKLDQARRAALRLIDLLGDGDELTVVSFGSDVTSSERRAMDAAGKAALRDFVARVDADGATFLSGALEQAARDLASATLVRRLVLISDGQPTTGVTDLDGILALAARVHDAGVAVTALGVGSDYNTLMMQALAERGGGFTGSLDDAGRLEEVLGLELAQARGTSARNVTLALEPGPGVTLLDTPGRLAHTTGGRTVLDLRDLRPGEQTKVYLRVSTAPTFASALDLVTAHVAWTDPASNGQRLAHARLALSVTSEPNVFAASKDEAVYAAGVRALGTTKMVAAAAALERGDKDSAFTLLESARSIFGSSADALAGDIETTRRLSNDWRTASGEEARRHAMDLERKSLKSFGKSEAY